MKSGARNNKKGARASKCAQYAKKTQSSHIEHIVILVARKKEAMKAEGNKKEKFANSDPEDEEVEYIGYQSIFEYNDERENSDMCE